MTLREKCLYAELFWSLFSRIRTEYGKILCISPYSIRIGGNTQQSNSEYRHFSRRARLYKNLNLHSWIPAHQDKYHRNYFQIHYYWSEKNQNEWHFSIFMAFLKKWTSLVCFTMKTWKFRFWLRMAVYIVLIVWLLHLGWNFHCTQVNNNL